MCAYDSQAAGENWQGWSRWCGVFSRAEWDIIGYLRDVQRYYEIGQGSVSGSYRFLLGVRAKSGQRYVG
jgi:hypothetical protein